VKDALTRNFKGGETNVEIERLFMIWIHEKQMQGESVSSQFIFNRAREIFEDLKRKSPLSSGSQFEEFKASKGWFENFKKRTEIKSVVRHGEAASADTEGAEKFKTKFAESMEEEGYLPQQSVQC
jgi:hypothetical protein